ncbi:MAG TPA: potassium transporter TrkG [Synergistales bacterium]|nr:potassium transporter TrkG [Synergistales bacterium]HQQ10444.1 potassium transporter TrkG [Synergistales bacterium]
MLGFLSLIASGTLLIMLFNAGTRPLGWIDALFTATSSVCVTGLIVVDTGKDLSLASQGVVLFLIQLGGLGVMTATTAFFFLMKERIGLRQRMFFAGGFGLDSPSGVIRLLVRILLLTFVIEGIGIIPLYFGFLKSGMGHGRSLYSAVFHSISAFCNAGFSLFPDNLESFSRTILVPGTVMCLVVIGGLGFVVLTELREMFLRARRITLQTKLVLVTTVFLVILGSVVLVLTEWGNAFGDLQAGWKVWNGVFSSITPRTAGFDTVAPVNFSSAGIFVLVLLMLIGASPGSTGGGIKTTTLAILLVSTWNFLKGRHEIHLWNRKLPFSVLQRSVTVVVLYLGTLLVGIGLLVLIEPFPFRALLFEVASALGTVGLSLGITPELSDAGKIVLVLMMFWGRVGIVTFLYSLLKRETRERVSYPVSEVPVG